MYIYTCYKCVVLVINVFSNLKILLLFISIIGMGGTAQGLCAAYRENNWALQKEETENSSHCAEIMKHFLIFCAILPGLENVTCQMASRNLGMASKLLPKLATVMSDLFMGDFLNIQEFINKYCLLRLDAFYWCSKKVLLYFPFPQQNFRNGNYDKIKHIKIKTYMNYLMVRLGKIFF